MKKYILSFFLTIFFFILLIIVIGINAQSIKHWAGNNIPEKPKMMIKSSIKWLSINTPNKIKVIIEVIIKDKKFTNRFYNDYNIKFLPQTQFKKIKFERKKLEFLVPAELNYLQKMKKNSLNYLSFYIESLGNSEILVTDSTGNFTLLKNFFENDNKNKKIIKIRSNLQPHKVLDTYIYQNTIFVSYVELINECATFNIALANLNFEKLFFKNFFKNQKCGFGIQGGRMQSYKYNNNNGLIFSIADNIIDKPNNDPQNDQSFYGKIVFKSFEDTFVKIISKGHRNPQGLYAKNNVIISTEHGPNGGDEINNIKINKNYGWPISSYGKKYSEKDISTYKLAHSIHGFEEPIYSFIPSVGISEIIKIPNNFIKSWENNFLIASLNKGSLFRVRFDKKFKKILYNEEIYIGQRIRDIKYDIQNKTIILALESNGELGFLKIDK